MRDFSISPREMISCAWRNRGLIWQMTRREVVGRYRGSVMGVMWSFFNPVLMLVVYTFVFSVVFKARWNPGSDSKTEFALVLFAGLLVFSLFSECVGRAPSLVISNVNYVKKVVFPLEILPWIALGSALFHMTVSLLVWIAFYVVSVGMPQPTALLLPFVLLPLALLTLGLTMFLASVGVYLRDVAQVVGIAVTVLMFLSPIFYPVSALPPEFQPLLLLNPLALAIEHTRAVLVWGHAPDLIEYLAYLSACALVAWLGFAWFQRTRHGSADVI